LKRWIKRQKSETVQQSETAISRLEIGGWSTRVLIFAYSS